MRSRIIGCSVLAAILSLGLLGSGCGHDKTPQSQASSGKAAVKYRCPMHPQHVSDRSADCPICGMKLVQVKEDAAGHEGEKAGSMGVEGRRTVTLSAEKKQLIGLRTAKVELKEITDTVRATATVQPDERLQSKIVARFNGWVRSLHVNYTGQAVTNGEALMTVYAPELLGAENDFHLSYMSVQKSTNASAEQKDAVKRRFEAARRKLDVWQVGEPEMLALQQAPPPTDDLLLRSAVTGNVTAKEAYVGMTFRPGDVLYEISDLSHVWLRAFIFEHELPRIEVGQKAWVTFPYQGNRLCECSVTFIAPRIDPQTRRAEVRLELDNPGGDLRPETWGNVEIEVALGKRQVVPASAVIDTGTRYVAFVQREHGQLEPRELKVGTITDDYYEVLEGLVEGENVVTRALFLIDSESQLKAAVAGMDEHEAHKPLGHDERMTRTNGAGMSGMAN